MPGYSRLVRFLAGIAAGAILAMAGVPSNFAQAQNSFLPSSGMSPFIAAAEQTPPESSRESDARRQRPRQTGTNAERNKHGLEAGSRAMAPAGTGENFTPSLPNANLQLPNATPQLPNAVPQSPNAVPQFPNAVPQLPNAVPQLPEAPPPVPGGVRPLPAIEPLPDRP